LTQRVGYSLDAWFPVLDKPIGFDPSFPPAFLHNRLSIVFTSEESDGFAHPVLVAPLPIPNRKWVFAEKKSFGYSPGIGLGHSSLARVGYD